MNCLLETFVVVLGRELFCDKFFWRGCNMWIYSLQLGIPPHRQCRPPKSTWGTSELYWGYLQEQRCLKDSYSTKAHPSMGDNSQSWEPGAHCTACRQTKRWASILVTRCLSWCKPFPGSLAVSDHYGQVVWSQSLLCLGLPENLFSFYCLFCQGGA